MSEITVRPMMPEDWTAVSKIYLEGIATEHATFQTNCPPYTAWDASHTQECRLVVLDDGSAKALYKEYVNKGLTTEPPFKGVGTQYILFAVNEPKLFQLLFMTEQKQIPDLSGVLPLIDESYEQILLSIQDDYKICKAAGKKLYHHLWIYTHGIATLCATKMCRFTDEEISTMITEVCMSILKKLKEGENND